MLDTTVKMFLIELITLIICSFLVGAISTLEYTRFLIKKRKRLPYFLKLLVTINEEKGGATVRK